MACMSSKWMINARELTGRSLVSFSLTAWPFRFRLFRVCHSELWNWGEGLRHRRNAAFRCPHRSLQGRQVPDVGWQTQTFFPTGLTLSFHSHFSIILYRNILSLLSCDFNMLLILKKCLISFSKFVWKHTNKGIYLDTMNNNGSIICRFIIKYPVSMRGKRTNYIYRETFNISRKMFLGQTRTKFFWLKTLSTYFM